MKFAPDAFAGGIDERIRVAAEPVKVTIAGGNTAIAEQDRHLVKRFRAKRPEIPLHVHVAQIGLGCRFCVWMNIWNL